jgi:gas vesicle protein
MEDSKVPYFLFGLGMGVAIGILFAPKSGQQTREMLRSKADEGREYLRRKGEEVKETTSDILNRGREAYQTQKENLAAALEAGKQAYRQSVGGEQPKGAEKPAASGA